MTAPMIAAYLFMLILFVFNVVGLIYGPDHVKRAVKVDIVILATWVAIMVWGGFFNGQ
jgi:multisubunit Na+/H+ antiporter MnhF subunit